MEIVNFTKCTLAFMEESIGLRRIPSAACPTLLNWIKSEFITIDDFERESIRRLSLLLDDNGFHWREYDLSLHFIGPIFSLVNFTVQNRFNLFAQEGFEALVTPDITLAGRVDEVIASGFRIPKLPFFAINEYKKETDPDGDPNGQCLAAMLVAQKLNNNDLPIYGCVIVGRVWRFVVLEDKNYAFSQNFDGAVMEDTCQIVCILKQLKVYCMLRTA
jgi:hypothetical protein